MKQGNNSSGRIEYPFHPDSTLFAVALLQSIGIFFGNVAVFSDSNDYRKGIYCSDQQSKRLMYSDGLVTMTRLVVSGKQNITGKG